MNPVDPKYPGLHPTDAAAPKRTADDGRWILRTRQLLDDSARDLDGATLSKLNRARQAALADVAPRRVRRAGANSGRWLAWVGSAAIVAGVAVAMSRLLPIPDAAPAPVATRSPNAAPIAPSPHDPAPVRIAPSEDTPLSAPDFELLVDAEDEALLDDLEFYAWLEANEHHDG